MPIIKSRKNWKNIFNLCAVHASNERISKFMDILKSDRKLKQMPFDIPDGYFSSFEHRMLGLAEKDKPYQKSHKWNFTAFKSVQVLAAAAAVAAAVVGGFSISEHSRTARQQEQMAQDSFFYTELMPVTGAGIIYEDDSYGSYIADTDISDEDIIDYLIYSGTPVELLNTPDYE